MESAQLPITNKWIKESIAYAHNGILVIHKEEWDYVVLGEISGKEIAM